MAFTDSLISGPIPRNIVSSWLEARQRLYSPSPGIKVTVYFPYNNNSCWFRGIQIMKKAAHIRAFLTSEGGGWSGRSVMTEGLRICEL